MSQFEVAVYGASGHTGQQVAAALKRRGVQVRAVARRAAPGLLPDGIGPLHIAPCDDPDALDRAFRDVHAVINCAGPFLDTAPAVIEAALRANAHYFDITAEQRSARQSLATYAVEARQRGVVIMPAMAFFGGLGDLLATSLCQGSQSIEEILIGIALNRWHPTVGTRRTGDANTARRVVVNDGVITPAPGDTPLEAWDYPQPFGRLTVQPVPLAEIVTLSHHLPATRIETYMNTAPLEDLADPSTPSPVAGANGTSDQQFVLEAIVTADGTQRRASVSGQDIYASTAPLVVEACLRVLTNPAEGGAFAPGELFDADDFLAALSPSMRVTRSDHHAGWAATR